MAITEPEYLENKTELTKAGATASAPSLAEKFSAHARDNDDLLGLDSKSKAGLMDRGQNAAKNVNDQRQRESEKAKQRTGDIMFLHLLDQRLAEWDKEIQDMEARFAALYGENWREDLASELLNEIPEQRAGESLEAYQERLESLLVGEMIDPATGKLKEEYRNHPDQRIREYGLWAESRHNFDKATDLVDTVKHGTEQEKAVALEALTKSNNAEIATTAAVKFKDDKANQAAVQTADDAADDQKLTGQQADVQIDSSGFDLGYKG